MNWNLFDEKQILYFLRSASLENKINSVGKKCLGLTTKVQIDSKLLWCCLIILTKKDFICNGSFLLNGYIKCIFITNKTYYVSKCISNL